MKFNRLFTKVMFMTIAVASLCVSIACSESGADAPTPTPPNTVVPAGDDGEINFDVTNDDGESAGTSPQQPAEVKADEPLNVTIEQNSSYADPNGTTYNCNPKATINATVQLDTVYATDLAALTTLIGTPRIVSNTTGDNPKIHSTDQSFNIGGQKVNFNLDYEVYTHTNSRNQLIEMPYVKINNAEYGNSSSIESRSGDTSVRLADITVTPADNPQSRSITVTDSTAYEVTARFHIDVEGKNSASDAMQTLSFEVKYTAILTETATYDGANLETTFTRNGEATTATQFDIAPAETLNLVITQNSSYTDQNGAQVATITSKVDIISPDTVTIENREHLTNDHIKEMIAISTEGFDHLTAPMPYYEFGEIAFISASVSPIIEEEFKTVYEITARYTHKATPVNVETATNQPQEITLDYIVRFYAMEKITLVDTKYQPVLTYVPPRPELPLGGYYNEVLRHRIYSNGDTITDHYRQPGSPWAFTANEAPAAKIWAELETINYTHNEMTDSTTDHIYDTYAFISHNTDINEASKLEIEWTTRGEIYDFGTFRRPFDQYKYHSTDVNNGSLFKNYKSTGWYYYNFYIQIGNVNTYYNGKVMINSSVLFWNLHHYFLYIDKHIVEMPYPEKIKEEFREIEGGYNESRGLYYRGYEHTAEFKWNGMLHKCTYIDTFYFQNP